MAADEILAFSLSHVAFGRWIRNDTDQEDRNILERKERRDLIDLFRDIKEGASVSTSEEQQHHGAEIFFEQLLGALTIELDGTELEQAKVVIHLHSLFDGERESGRRFQRTDVVEIPRLECACQVGIAAEHEERQVGSSPFGSFGDAILKSFHVLCTGKFKRGVRQIGASVQVKVKVFGRSLGGPVGRFGGFHREIERNQSLP